MGHATRRCIKSNLLLFMCTSFLCCAVVSVQPKVALLVSVFYEQGSLLLLLFLSRCFTIVGQYIWEAQVIKTQTLKEIKTINIFKTLHTFCYSIISLWKDTDKIFYIWGSAGQPIWKSSVQLVPVNMFYAHAILPWPQ